MLPGAVSTEALVAPTGARSSSIPADVVLGGPGLEELFLSRATHRDVGGAHVPVASPEDLIVMKLLAGREKDKEDVLAVLRAGRASLDLGGVRATVEMLEEALGQSDLRPLLEQLVARAKRASS